MMEAGSESRAAMRREDAQRVPMRCPVCKGRRERNVNGSRMMARRTKRKPCTGCGGYGAIK